jgi:hypothetical protein
MFCRFSLFVFFLLLFLGYQFSLANFVIFTMVSMISRFDYITTLVIILMHWVLVNSITHDTLCVTHDTICVTHVTLCVTQCHTLCHTMSHSVSHNVTHVALCYYTDKHTYCIILSFSLHFMIDPPLLHLRFAE